MTYDLGDYVDVKTRLVAALAKYPDLGIVEETPEIIRIGDSVYVQCAVTVHRTHNDPLPVRAFCWEVWPGRTPYTRDSEQPNGATSALGRALGYMGFGIDAGLASANEVRTAQGNNAGHTPAPTPRPPHGRGPAPAYDPTAPRMASPKQLDLLATMYDERNMDRAGIPEGMTYAEASDEITRVKGIARPTKPKVLAPAPQPPEEPF